METKLGPCLCGEPEKVITDGDKQVLIRCPLYIKLRGNNPQGGEVDEWGCAISWIPILLIENTKKVIEMGAAIESFRNEMVVQNDKIIEKQLENHEPSDLLIGR